MIPVNGIEPCGPTNDDFQVGWTREHGIALSDACGADCETLSLGICDRCDRGRFSVAGDREYVDTLLDVFVAMQVVELFPSFVALSIKWVAWVYAIHSTVLD